MFLSVHLGNFSPADLGACSSRNKTKMVEHLRLLYGFVDCFNFTTNSAVEKHTSQKLCHFCHCCWDSEAILSKNVSFRASRSPGLNCSYGKIFIPNTEISVAKSEISVTEAAQLLISSNWFFCFEEKRRGEISEMEPAQSTGLTWRGPLLRTPERVRVQKPWRSVQSTLA